MTVTIRELEREAVPVVDADPPPVRPKTRGECVGGHRPCPWVGCRHHLYLEAQATGSIKLIFPDLEPDEMVESCSLDVADRGAQTELVVAAALNVTRQRVTQIEEETMRTLRRLPLAREVRDEALGLETERDRRMTWMEQAKVTGGALPPRAERSRKP